MAGRSRSAGTRAPGATASATAIAAAAAVTIHATVSGLRRRSSRQSASAVWPATVAPPSGSRSGGEPVVVRTPSTAAAATAARSKAVSRRGPEIAPITSQRYALRTTPPGRTGSLPRRPYESRTLEAGLTTFVGASPYLPRCRHPAVVGSNRCEGGPPLSCIAISCGGHHDQPNPASPGSYRYRNNRHSRSGGAHRVRLQDLWFGRHPRGCAERDHRRNSAGPVHRDYGTVGLRAIHPHALHGRSGRTKQWAGVRR